MTLKTKAALTYILPLLLVYVAAVSAMSAHFRPSWAGVLAGLVPASALVVVSHLFQDVMPKPFKEFLVFFRVRNRLPGHRAYTKVCVGDPRIPAHFLGRMQEETKCEPLDQNAAWYGHYRKAAKEPSVEHENVRFLGWRDATAALILLAAFTLALRFLAILPWTGVAYVAMGCLAAAVLTGSAARNAATALVRNVAAIEATGSADGPME